MNAARPTGQIAIALTVALLGFLLATQLRAQQGLAQRLQIERESDLGQILAGLTARNDQLVEEIGNLRVQLATSAGSQAQQKAIEADARAQLSALRVLLGTVAVRGPGITATVADPKATITADVVLDAIEELRDAGAEAIQIGASRVVASTSFSGSGGKLFVDGAPLKAPFVISAVGAPDTLAEAMRIPGGVIDSISSRDGASVRVAQNRNISILAVRSTPRFEYARPVSRR